MSDSETKTINKPDHRCNDHEKLETSLTLDRRDVVLEFDIDMDEFQSRWGDALVQDGNFQFVTSMPGGFISFHSDKLPDDYKLFKNVAVLSDEMSSDARRLFTQMEAQARNCSVDAVKPVYKIILARVQ